MTRPTLLRLAPVLLVWLARPTAATAQPIEAPHDPTNASPPPITSKVNFAVGYSVTRYSPPEAVTVGWSVALAARPARYFEVVSELSGTQESNAPGSATEQRNSVLFLNGPRIVRRWPHVTILGDALLGIAQRDLPGNTSADRNRFLWRPGAGIDIHIAEHVSGRFHIGRTFNLDSAYDSVVQFTTAVVFSQ